MYYTILLIGLQSIMYLRMKAAGCKPITRTLFALWAVFWTATGYIAHYDYAHAEYDILPGKLTEILRAAYVTWAIMSVIIFFALLGVWVLSGFKELTRKKFFVSMGIAAIGILYSMFEAYYVTPRYVEIHTRKLPEGTDRLRIVAVADAHIGGLATHWHFARVKRLVDEAHPDIIALLGDTLDGFTTWRERELAMLTDSAKRARLGAFAINGNHEYYWLLDDDVEQAIRDCGYNLLINERAECASLTIISLDDQIRGWLKPYLLPEDSERFVLVLKHRPGLPFDAEGKFDLQLSGHTHGGQFWPLGYFKSMAANSVQGLSQKAGGYVYVSNGSGFNGAMMRLFVPPEITVIDLVREH